MQQDRDAACGTAPASAVASLEAAVYVGVSFHTQFLACKLESRDLFNLVAVMGPLCIQCIVLMCWGNFISGI